MTERISTLLSNPIRAISGDALLLEPVLQFELVVGDAERLLLGLRRVERSYELRLAEKKPQMADLVQFSRRGLIGVDRKIRGDEREVGARANFLPKEFADFAAAVIIADSGDG